MKINPLLFLALLACPPLHAQELLELNAAQRCIYTGALMDEELYRFPESDRVNAWVKEIAELGDTEINFEVVQTNVENVSAVLDGEKRYLLYSLDFVEKNTELEVVVALAHEVGHHANGHHFSAERRKTEELEADQFMGYVMSKRGFTMPDIEAFLKKLPSSYELSFEDRRLVVGEGFDKAGRSMQINSLPFDNNPQLDELTLPGFPWPPPSCNARFAVPVSSFAGYRTLGDVERKICTALDAKGYAQRSYFSVPNGFAIVTQLEQYNAEDGTARNDRTRWLDYPAKDNFAGVLDYLKSFVMPQKGYFRLFVFVATNQPFGGSAQRVSKDQAAAWLNLGFNKLPRSLATAPFSAGYDVTALVYEFEVPESNRKPIQKCPAPLFDAKTHLQKSGIAAGLGF
ncbi:MAG: hypothetical protein EPGJADBJ_04563 [Saprospiraceae bacterium]|nr:hypothetical protein [Saprospiraceae bacterium]